jgi:mono/diheme cytochrome c family protein
MVLGLFTAQTAPARQDASATKAASRHIGTNLVFDATTKYYDAKVTDSTAAFKFSITNVWTNEITVDRMDTSCGCTVATMPANPWHIGPGEHGIVDVTVNLEGKAAGQMTKFVTLYLSANGKFLGTRVGTLKITVPERPNANVMATMSESDRKAALLLAKADPQKIFTDPGCAKCHADRGRKSVSGPDLYAADCGICHDSPNRASFVPDLHALKVPRDLGYWTAIITYGKTNTMMPAFASFKGGPLNENQVHILADYLASDKFSRVTAKTASNPAVPVDR